MASMEEVRVKNEPICFSHSISQTKRATEVKEEPIDIEMKTYKLEEVKVKAEKEEKFSASEEFVNKTSIAFLSEETTETISNSQTNKQIKKNRNKLEKSK